jgi:hypothetical protein
VTLLYANERFAKFKRDLAIAHFSLALYKMNFMQIVPFIMSLSKEALFLSKSAAPGTAGGKCRAQEHHTRDTVFNYKISQRVQIYKFCPWKEIITCLVLRPITKQLFIF